MGAGIAEGLLAIAIIGIVIFLLIAGFIISLIYYLETKELFPKVIFFIHLCIIGIPVLFLLGFYLFQAEWFLCLLNGRSHLSNDWQKRFSNTELFNEYSANNKIELNNVIIKGARIPSSHTSNFMFKNVEFIDFGGKESQWKNGEFIDSTFNDFSFYNAHLKNVTFKNSKFVDSHFSKAKLENVKFINCEISKSSFGNMRESSIEFIDTKINSNNYNFSDSQINLKLINSNLINIDLRSLKEGSSIHVENSTIDNVSFQHSKMDSFKSVNSKMLNSTLGDSEIKELSFDKSHIHISFGDAIIKKVTVTESKIDNLGAIRVKTDIFSITDCDKNADVTFAKSNIKIIKINNCDFAALYPANLNAETLSIENTTIADSIFYKSKVKNFKFRNVTLNKEADFENFHADTVLIENITKDPNLKLTMDGANIEL